jgi:hypothetical protein
MLRDQGIIAEADAAAILEGLDQIAAEYERDGVPERVELEDIHMTVEHRLGELIGAAAGRLHTARSRNDQVATDFRLWVRNACDEAVDAVRELQRVLVERAEEHAESAMPGFTHLQVAQPVTLGHHLMAYYEMLRRDLSRFNDARARMNESPLGSAALAGTGFPLDRHATADALGFERPTANSIDSVSDRDFAIDYLAAATQCSLHLSRLAEELIIWATSAFGFLKLSDQFSTGSSIMPQKRNPDAAELVRGHSGRILGSLTALMVTMKGLPLAYSKDMQDDKEPVFEAHDLLVLSLRRSPEWSRRSSSCPSGCAPLRRGAIRPRPILPTGSFAKPASHSAKRIHYRARGEGSRGTRLRPRRPAARRLADDRRMHRRQRVRCSQYRRLGPQPNELRRHGTCPRPRADRRSQGNARALAAAAAAPACAAGARSAG